MLVDSASWLPWPASLLEIGYLCGNQKLLRYRCVICLSELMLFLHSYSILTYNRYLFAFLLAILHLTSLAELISHYGRILFLPSLALFNESVASLKLCHFFLLLKPFPL
jgi:hypothetical protein